MTYFNPLDMNCKYPTGAVNEKTEIRLNVFGDFKACTLIINRDGTPFFQKTECERIDGGFTVKFKLPVGLYYYFFQLEDNLFLGLGSDLQGVLTDCPEKFQLTVYSKDYEVPDFLNGGIIYQIFPDRFNRAEKDKKVPKNKVLHNDLSDTPIFLPDENGIVQNNDFFGGDFKGIIEKLDYLKSLSVTAIYLNPIFEAYSNHRYDTGDYMKIDPLLGTEKDFENLIKECDKRGIKVILDGVFNHTGDDSVYFNKYGRYKSVGAVQSPDSPYKYWYKFIDYPKVYESWWGITTLPAVNKEKDSGFINFITKEGGVIDKWTSKGIGGWRLDVVDELPAHFVREIRKAVKRANNDAIIIGEVWEDASNKISYGIRREYFQGKELDSVMNYPLKNAIINFACTGDSETLSLIIKEQIDHYPKAVLNSLMNILSTHDTFRLLSAVGGENYRDKTKEELSKLYISPEKIEKAIFRVKVCSALQYFLCGVPSIYYGDEIGMQGYSDPLNRKYFTWENVNSEIYNWYVKLGKIRREFSCFSSGDFTEIFKNNGIYIFSRKDGNNEVMVLINASVTGKNVNFNGKLYDLISEKEVDGYYNLLPNTIGVLINKN